MSLDEELRRLVADAVRPIVREEVRAALAAAPGVGQQREGLETLWDVNGVARYLKMSRSWVYKASEAGILPTVQIGGRTRFDPEHVRAFARGEPPPRRRPVEVRAAPVRKPAIQKAAPPPERVLPEPQPVKASTPAPATSPRTRTVEEILELERMLSVREVAKRLSVSTATVYKLCDDGKLPHTRVSNAIRLRPEDVAAFVEARRNTR